MLQPTRDLNSLREQLAAEGVEFLIASFSDMHSVSKTKMVPLGAITARTLLMPCKTDLYFRTADNAAELAHLKNGDLVEIPSYWGHMSGAGQNEADTLFIDAHLRELLAASLAD
jgi:homoserine acetyltransferase